MLIGLYLDVHVPSAVTEGLRRRGIDILTSQEDGTRRDDDDSLLKRSAEQGRLFVTQDHDFLRIASEWQNAGKTFCGIVFAPQIGVSIGRMIDDLELIVSCAREEELRDQITYLPLS